MRTLSVHSHGCSDITDGKDCLLFDPWLLGSAYWRSWWNFPEPTSVEDLCERLRHYNSTYIYLTHLHWDHFHGPSIRALISRLDNIVFLIPKTPESRLLLDLKDVIHNQIPIHEISHNQCFYINPSFSIVLFSPGYLLPTLQLVNVGSRQILNLNDSKPQKYL